MGRKNQRNASPPPSAEAASSSAVAVDAEPAPEPKAPLQILYCGVCSWPHEYCEFGSHFTKCKDWLKENHSEVYDRYYSEDALAARLGTISLEAQAKLEKDTAKKEAKAEAKEAAELKKKMASQVTIKRVERTKRKHVTIIAGLHLFSIDLKKAAKQFASRFATGASVTKTLTNEDEIVVQGDVVDEVYDMIVEGKGVLKGVPEDNVEIVEDKKKKGD